ncbi:hypothetical protein MKX03_021524 [Papaver bracteatum]|nr:hypothetical protein MKX03_021524 [Papaver bracteatum]
MRCFQSDNGDKRNDLITTSTTRSSMPHLSSSASTSTDDFRRLDSVFGSQNISDINARARINSSEDSRAKIDVAIKQLGKRGLQIIFRDFKFSNILLDDQWNAKLSDFDLAREGPTKGASHVSTTIVGTFGYAAPEYIQTGRLTTKNDVYSYGVFPQLQQTFHKF